eukprot:TRINITY_DN40238_c0_g1_i1.p1 TRINITY_DN40238_c0_g1~~TRINITY_DN40238_c0_g1_i1.p1  ORF type:complete len:798 (-),score=152.21 TRINITY_DN40238_c0_g1_i1:155-2548(-)
MFAASAPLPLPPVLAFSHDVRNSKANNTTSKIKTENKWKMSAVPPFVPKSIPRARPNTYVWQKTEQTSIAHWFTRLLRDINQNTEPHSPPPSFYYPELSGIELLMADLRLIKYHANHIKSFFGFWNTTLPETYDPNKIANCFNQRPHLLVFRILEISAALAHVILNFKFNQAVQTKGGPSDDKLQSMYRMGENLKETMLRLGPTFVKVGQSISTRPDLVGEEVAKALAELQDQLPPFPMEEALKIIEDDLNCALSLAFSSISAEPIAAASFGQVYKGCTVTGEDVAIKVQRPHALFNVARDIYILRICSGVLGKLLQRKSDLRVYVDEIGQGLFGELDYLLEAQRASEFKEAHSNLPFMMAPKPFIHLTRKRVLTMEWIDGYKPKDLLSMSSTYNSRGDKYSEEQCMEARIRLLSLVNNGVEACLAQLLETGLLHADPHPGNLLYTSSDKICFLDFGLLCKMEKKHQFAMLASIVHIANADWSSLVYDLLEMDMIRPETDLRQVEMEFHFALGDVNADAGIPDVKFSKILGKIWSVAMKYHFKMPSYYTLVLRSIASLEGLALAVDPNFKTFEAAYPYVMRKLLLDNSSQMRKILYSLILNDANEIRWAKLATFLKLVNPSVETSKKRLIRNDFFTAMLETSQDAKATYWACNILKLLSSQKGANLRRLLVTIDTASLAKEFLSKSSNRFLGIIVQILKEELYEWAWRRFQKQNMERNDEEFVLLKACQDMRIKVVLKMALAKLTRTPMLMIRVLWKFGLVVCGAAVLALHRLLVQLCTVHSFKSKTFKLDLGLELA